MDKKTLAKSCAGIVALSSAILLSACAEEESSTSSSKASEPEVASVKDIEALPACKKSTVDSVITVTSENADYICYGATKEWVKVVDKLPKCSISKEGLKVYVDGEEEAYVCAEGWETLETSSGNSDDGDDVIPGTDSEESAKSSASGDSNSSSSKKASAFDDDEEPAEDEEPTDDGDDDDDIIVSRSSSSKRAASSSSREASSSSLTASSSSQTASSASAKSSASIIEIDDDYGLGECTLAKHGTVAKFTIDNQYYICNIGTWKLATQVEYNTYGYNCSDNNIEEIISGNVNTSTRYICTSDGWRVSTTVEYDTYGNSCSENNIGEIISGNVNTSTRYTCTSDGWRASTTTEINTYQMPCTADNINETANGLVNTSYIYTCTTSGWQLLSGTLDINVKATGDLWNNTSGDLRATTGLDDGSDESGIWFYYDDASEKGNSTITFPATVSDIDYYGKIGAVIKDYGTITGSYSLGSGYQVPFVGIGINLTGPYQTGADITDWGGICLVYAATGFSPQLELAPQDAQDYTRNDNYYSRLAIAVEPTVVDLPWAKFKQDNWGIRVDQSQFLQKTASIKFRFLGSADKSGDFAIYAIGRAGSCSIVK